MESTQTHIRWRCDASRLLTGVESQPTVHELLRGSLCCSDRRWNVRWNVLDRSVIARARLLELHEPGVHCQRRRHGAFSTCSATLSEVSFCAGLSAPAQVRDLHNEAHLIAWSGRPRSLALSSGGPTQTRVLWRAPMSVLPSMFPRVSGAWGGRRHGAALSSRGMHVSTHIDCLLPPGTRLRLARRC